MHSLSGAYTTFLIPGYRASLKPYVPQGIRRIVDRVSVFPEPDLTFLNSPPWQQKIFSSTIAAIGKQLKQSVNVFQSLMLYRLLPTKQSVRLPCKAVIVWGHTKTKTTYIKLQGFHFYSWATCKLDFTLYESSCYTGIQICLQCTENNTKQT